MFFHPFLSPLPTTSTIPLHLRRLSCVVDPRCTLHYIIYYISICARDVPRISVFPSLVRKRFSRGMSVRRREVYGYIFLCVIKHNHCDLTNVAWWRRTILRSSVVVNAFRTLFLSLTHTRTRAWYILRVRYFLISRYFRPTAPIHPRTRDSLGCMCCLHDFQNDTVDRVLILFDFFAFASS